jgi:uncharacterized membrane protein YkoI
MRDKSLSIHLNAFLLRNNITLQVTKLRLIGKQWLYQKSNPYHIMINSKMLSKKVLIPTAIVAVAVGLTLYGLSPAIAAVNQTMNGVTPGYAQMPKITGSVSVEQAAKNLMKDNLKVSFPQASEIAAKQIVNGTIVGGHLGIVQGYLVYTFFVLNPQNQTGHLTIIDAGNGKVLYTSQGVSSDYFGRSSAFGPFGTFGPWVGHGFGGGFWHGSFGARGFHGFGNGLGSN